MKTLLLLHGALGSTSQLQPLQNALSGNYNVHSLNFKGHGGTGLNEEFSIMVFASQVLDWLRENRLDKVSIFGYSMGGYVALYLAKKYPDLVAEVITLGTKLDWNEATATKEVAMMNPEIIEQKVPKFAQQLQQVHYPVDWKVIMNKTAQMLLAMGKDNPLKSEAYAQISSKVLLMIGDRDKMVSLDETVDCYKQLQKGSLSVLPSTPHAVEQINVGIVTAIINDFLKK